MNRTTLARPPRLEWGRRLFCWSACHATDRARDRHQRRQAPGQLDFNKYGGDIIFRVSRPADQTLVALAKYGFVFFNYGHTQVVPMPEEFASHFPQVNYVD